MSICVHLHAPGDHLPRRLAVGVRAVRLDFAVRVAVLLVAGGAARGVLKVARPTVEPRVAHADDLPLSVQPHVPHRRRPHDGADSPYRIRAGLGDLHAVGVEDAVLHVRLNPRHLGALGKRGCHDVRVVTRRGDLEQLLGVVLHGEQPGVDPRAARPRAQSSASGAPAGAPLAQFAGVRGREVGGGGAQVAVALVRQEHHVERDGRAVGGRALEVWRHLELGKQRHDAHHLRLRAQALSELDGAVHHEMPAHGGAVERHLGARLKRFAQRVPELHARRRRDEERLQLPRCERLLVVKQTLPEVRVVAEDPGRPRVKFAVEVVEREVDVRLREGAVIGDD